MAPTTVCFASPRGGSGKSTVAAQLSAAFAAHNELRNVLLIDCSLHADSTVYLLGGVREPDELVHGIHTQGQLVMHKNPTKTAADFFTQAYNAKSGSTLGRAWRSIKSPMLEDFMIKSSVASNLFVLPGGPKLYEAVTSVNRADVSKAVYEKIQNLGDDWMVVFDLDAELMERPASLLGLEVSNSIVVVLSPQWADFQRVVDDPINSLFTALKHLRNTTGQHGTVSAFLFNKCEKTRNAESLPFPFTGVNSAVEACAQICGYAQNQIFSRETGFSQFFNVTTTNAERFAVQYVTALHNLPENIIQKSNMTGVQIPYLTTGSGVTQDALDTTKTILDCVRAKLEDGFTKK